MKKAVALCAVLIFLLGSTALSEDEYQPLYVMCNNLRGRMRAGKKYEAVTSFDMGMKVMPTGRISEDRQWVEIRTAEFDVVWCNINYLTETTEVLHIYTLWDEGVRIRSKPGGGKVTGTARKNQTLEITQVVMGYGKCSRGWVDMEYFIIDCE